MILHGILALAGIVGFWQLVFSQPLEGGASTPFGMSWSHGRRVDHLDLGDWRIYSHGRRVHLTLPVGMGLRCREYDPRIYDYKRRRAMHVLVVTVAINFNYFGLSITTETR